MPQADKELETVVAYFKGLKNLTKSAGLAIRRAYDEVIDGPRTRRYQYEQLDNEEKTYVGKKVEIILRDAVGCPKGKICDLTVKGIEVDIKWSGSGNWMVPPENIDQLCLVLTATETPTVSTFSVGLIRANMENLRPKPNRDGKRGISAFGKTRMTWLVKDGALPENFLLRLDPKIREQILIHDKGQQRVTEMFRLVQQVPIPRTALDSVANQIDPAKRVRDARKRLKKEGIKIWSGRYNKAQIKDVGLSDTGTDEFISYSPK